MAISDKEGKIFGGHLKEDTIIHLTVEVVIGEDDQAVYTRELDEETRFASWQAVSPNPLIRTKTLNG